MKISRTFFVVYLGIPKKYTEKRGWCQILNRNEIRNRATVKFIVVTKHVNLAQDSNLLLFKHFIYFKNNQDMFLQKSQDSRHKFVLIPSAINSAIFLFLMPHFQQVEWTIYYWPWAKLFIAKICKNMHKVLKLGIGNQL
jgi:hypothetical protein